MINIFSVDRLNKWDLRFLRLAEHVASWSKDPSTKVGAVIVDNRRIVSLGFNGFPARVEDSEERLNNRDLKYRMVVHAEANAIIHARSSLQNCVLYTYPFMPCPVCAGQIIQSGISFVVAPYSDNPRWAEQFEITKEMFREAGIALALVRMDNE